MVELLTENGIKVVTLESPIGATREVMRSNVDIVVIDLMMPGLRGDRLAALFRENPRLAKLGLILVSGGTEEELGQLAVEKCVDAIVSKSRIHELPAVVQRVRRLTVGRGR
jgi:CheY-like chemotaxis protein